MHSEQDRAWDLVLRHRDFYGTYHHHKETMAYSATAFYIGGMSALIASGFWHEWPRSHQAVLASGIVVAAALTLAFVLWQLDRRLFGADMVAACTDLAGRWVTVPPQAAQLGIEEFDGREWPGAIVERFRQVRHRGPWLPRELTILAILLWTLASIAKIVAG